MRSRARFPNPLWVVLFGLVFIVGRVGTTVAGDDPAEIETTDSLVPMSDGIELATTVYRPKGDGPFPVVVARTPYNKDGMKNEAQRFCRNGYAYVAQDLRGRFKSKGHHAVIFHNDGWNTPHDGHDTLEWIARQSWCNGKIGSTGGSALGITQNMAAPGAPAALAAQHVVVAFSDMYRQGAYQGGAFRTGLLENWLKATGMADVNLKTFVSHPDYDAFWEELNAEPQAGRVNAPAVFFGGWYDIFLQGTINSFMTIQSHGGLAAKGRCRLVIAPIGHGSMNELKYPDSAGKLPRCADNLAWFDAMLKDKDNGIAAEKPVHYYVMGDPTDKDAPGNTWRAADTWPPPAAETPYYLHATGKLSTERPAESGSREYKYDPAQPVPTIGGAELGANIGPRDQRSVESRPDVLLFTSDVLETPLEVTGRIKARLYASSDCRDTDFTVKLTDVYPDGRSMLVTDGILRTRFRESFEKEKLLEPGEVVEIPIDLWSTSLVFNKGHRIRIAVSSSNVPRFDPNPNTGHAFRADKEQQVATNTVYFSEKYPSQIVLPVYGAAATVAQTVPAPSDGPFPAHRIIGNVYYVGSKDLASYLITTPEGHILINSGFEETVPLIRAAVESLGYKMRDIKILLESHAHSDHVAGHALAQELTNAKVYVMQGDDKVIASGGEGQYLYSDSRWKPCAVDVVLKDGDEVKLGSQTLVARSTPGHTRGCTTWTWRAADGDKKYDVVVIGSPNVSPGYRLVDNKEYPEIAADFDKTFKVLKALPCDIFLGAHGAYYGMPAKFDRIKSADQNPFIDPAGYLEYVSLKELAFRKTLAEQK